MAQKPSIPKGTRDFGPDEMARRNFIFDTIKDVFHIFGFSQIETPAMENLSTLMGKYGDEGDKLLFKILNSGDYLKNSPQEFLESKDYIHLTSSISEKGLRYDLTVPFARYVVMHRNDLNMPFKRYQIQPVWRADRPQRGRYREFYQCDADIVGSDSLWNEVELVSMIDEVFKRLGINIIVKINNRKVLSGIAQVIGEEDKIIDITVAIDKIDKIGIDNVNAELKEKGLSDEAINSLQPILSLSGNNDEKISTLKEILKESEQGLKGIEELQFVIDELSKLNLQSTIEVDVSLARGLNYYTGTILEVKAKDVEIGSISGGGRYDNLTGVFGMPDLSGVGISFGADRIYDVLNTLDKFPGNAENSIDFLFLNFGQKEASKSLEYIAQLRKHGYACELYPDNAKMKKQMTYANARKAPKVAMVGENELQQGVITVKDMISGEQQSLTIDQLVNS